MRRRALWALVAVGLVAVVAFVPPARSLWGRFFASLRIARPPAVQVNLPSFAGPTANRRIEHMVGSMLADSVSVTLDEADQSVPSAAAAVPLVGFTPLLPSARHDRPTLIVTGARAIAATVSVSQLRTILAEAGLTSVAVPGSLQGAALAIRTPRALRAQYGHCPRASAPTIQGQLQGPPPTSTDNGDCVVLTEGPAPAVDAPAALDLAPLVGIALELSGLSPDRARAFQATVDWKATLGLAIPRFVRSDQAVKVGGAPGILLGSAWRRGPTYVLIWTKGGTVFSLAGYGSPGDAVPLAASLAAETVR